MPLFCRESPRVALLRLGWLLFCLRPTAAKKEITALHWHCKTAIYIICFATLLYYTNHQLSMIIRQRQKRCKSVRCSRLHCRCPWGDSWGEFGVSLGWNATNSPQRTQKHTKQKALKNRMGKLFIVACKSRQKTNFCIRSQKVKKVTICNLLGFVRTKSSSND